MDETPLSVTFAESVYAMSKIAHIVGARSGVSLKLSGRQRKHLRLLDDIALLLVTNSNSANSDSAAVSLVRRPSEAHFYYAKNFPPTPADKIHIDELITDLKSLGTPTERIEKMLHKVIVVCGDKIHSRLRKLKVKLLENQASGGPCLRDDRNGELHRYFQSFGDGYAVYPTAAEFLTHFMLGITDPTVPSEPEKLFEILRIAHMVGSYNPVPLPDAAASYRLSEPIFIDPMLSRRMRLLGDYYGTVERIVRHCDAAAKRQSREIEIKFHPAPIAAHPEVTMPNDYLTILNSFVTEVNLPTVTYQTLATSYPHLTLPPTNGEPTEPVIQFVHAECTLASYLASLQRPWANIEIGCSKASCWLCELYLSHKQGDLTFHIRHVSGKLRSGWTMPEGIAARVEEYIRSLVLDEVFDVMLYATRDTRSCEVEELVDFMGGPFWVLR